MLAILNFILSIILSTLGIMCLLVGLAILFTIFRILQVRSGKDE